MIQKCDKNPLADFLARCASPIPDLEVGPHLVSIGFTIGLVSGSIILSLLLTIRLMVIFEVDQHLVSIGFTVGLYSFLIGFSVGFSSCSLLISIECRQAGCQVTRIL